MTKTVTALYDSYSEASSAVSALEAAGVPDSAISIVANNSESWHRDDRHTNAAEDATGGAEAGAIVGGLGGLLTGLGLMAIPRRHVKFVAAGCGLVATVGRVSGLAPYRRRGPAVLSA